MKAIETLEIHPEEETIDTGEDDEFEDTDQIDDLTVSTVGLKESSDIVLETPRVLSMPHGVELPLPSSSTENQVMRPVLRIPTSEDYEALMKDTILHTTEVGTISG